MQYLKQSTAKTMRVGPFLDEDDGKTAEVGLAIGQADIRLSKAGGAFAQSNDAGGAAHDEKGWYYLQLNATDTNTLGTLDLNIHEAGALPVYKEFMIIPANVYDSLFGSDKLQIDLIQIGGVAQSATDLKDFVDAGYDPITKKVQGVVLTDTATAITNNVTTDAASRTASKANVSNLDIAVSTRATPAQVKTQAKEVMDTDTHAEPAAGLPSNTPTNTAMINQIYRKIVKDKINFNRTTGVEITYMNDGTSTRHKRTATDSTPNTTKGAATA